MLPDAPDWPPHRISILTLAVFSRHTCRHTCHFQHNHYSCPVLLEQCRALKSQARQQSPCLVRTESAALFSSDTDFSPSPNVRQRTEVDRTPLRSRGIPARKGVLTALVLVLPLRSSPYRAARHEQHSEDNAHVHEGSVRGRGVRACSARHPEQQSSVMPP